VDLYEQRAEGLVRIDQLGWLRIPSVFPDSCMIRLPKGMGPAGGWDWNTSGGDIYLFYGNCPLRGPVHRHPWDDSCPPRADGGGKPQPTPARGSNVQFDYTVGRTLRRARRSARGL